MKTKIEVFTSIFCIFCFSYCLCVALLVLVRKGMKTKMEVFTSVFVSLSLPHIHREQVPASQGSELTTPSTARL